VALVTCAVGVIAAGYSGSALADPGLAPLVSGVTEPLPPAVADPIAGVGSAVEPLLEPVQPPVDEVATTVEDTGALVDATVSDVEQAVNGTLGTSTETLNAPGDASAPPTPAPPTPAPPAERTGVAAPENAAAHTSPASPGSESAKPEAAVLAAPTAATTALDPTPVTTVVAPISAVAPIAGANPPIAGAPSPRSGVVVAPAAAESPAGIAGPAQHEGMTSPPRPQLRSEGESLLFSALLRNPPSPAPLIVALLGLLALALPRPGGPRLHAAVAALRPADVRFRLVRPG
jgi:hypothetical protein